jgi:hypothetical protein
MSEQKLSDDELAEMERVCDELLPSRVVDLFGDAMRELRALRAAALSDADREALRWVRRFVAGIFEGAEHHAVTDLLPLLDRLLEQGGGR